jgi:hypothetical protein
MSDLLPFRYEFSKQCPINPKVAAKYGVKMKKPGEVTLESEYEKIKKVRNIRCASDERVPFSTEKKICVRST